MPTAKAETDPYESLDTGQRQRAVAVKAAQAALRSTGMFSPAAPIPAHDVIHVAEYIVSGNIWSLPPQLRSDLIGIDMDGVAGAPAPSHMFVGEPGEAPYDEARPLTDEYDTTYIESQSTDD